MSLQKNPLKNMGHIVAPVQTSVQLWMGLFIWIKLQTNVCRIRANKPVPDQSFEELQQIFIVKHFVSSQPNRL